MGVHQKDLLENNILADPPYFSLPPCGYVSTKNIIYIYRQILSFVDAYQQGVTWLAACM